MLFHIHVCDRFVRTQHLPVSTVPGGDLPEEDPWRHRNLSPAGHHHRHPLLSDHGAEGAAG